MSLLNTCVRNRYHRGAFVIWTHVTGMNLLKKIFEVTPIIGTHISMGNNYENWMFIVVTHI